MFAGRRTRRLGHPFRKKKQPNIEETDSSPRRLLVLEQLSPRSRKLPHSDIDRQTDNSSWDEILPAEPCGTQETLFNIRESLRSCFGGRRTKTRALTPVLESRDSRAGPLQAAPRVQAVDPVLCELWIQFCTVQSSHRQHARESPTTVKGARSDGKKAESFEIPTALALAAADDAAAWSRKRLDHRVGSTGTDRQEDELKFLIRIESVLPPDSPRPLGASPFLWKLSVRERSKRYRNSGCFLFLCKRF